MEIKYLLLVLPLLLLGCDDPKFHYKDCVKIEDKFYGTTYGIVTKYHGLCDYDVMRKIDNKVSEWSMNEQILTKVDSDYCRDIQN